MLVHRRIILSKKTKKKTAERGTYALCITAGLIFGVGLGATLNNLILITGLGIAAGAAVGYYFNHQKKSGKH